MRKIATVAKIFVVGELTAVPTGEIEVYIRFLW